LVVRKPILGFSAHNLVGQQNRGKGELREVIQLQARIDDAATEIERGYEDALKVVKAMKDKINGLEQSLSQKGHATRGVSGALNSAIEDLNELTDKLILRSERVEEEYEQLALDCRTKILQPPRLDELKESCSKTKELAMNLLCFSLGHFKRRKT
jgi:hypothetical protein